MADRQLHHAEAESARLDQELGAEGRPAGVYRHALPDRAVEQLEGAVDVAGGVAEQAIHQLLPAPGIDQPEERVGPPAPPADDQVGGAVQRREEIGQLVRQYPLLRNVTLRLLEPLGTPEDASPVGTSGRACPLAGWDKRAACPYEVTLSSPQSSNSTTLAVKP